MIAIKGFVLGSIILYGFYRTAWAIAAGVLFSAIYLHHALQQERKELLRRINFQFKSGLQGISCALSTGYSLEHAVKSAEQELELLYGKENELYREFCHITAQISMGKRVENLFLDLGIRCGLEDVMNFAEVLIIARKSGGDLIRMIGSAAEKIQDRIHVREEAQALIAGKRMELQVMNAILPGLLLYLNVASPGFLDVLYTTIGGRVFMTISLVIYIAAWHWGERIIEIEM